MTSVDLDAAELPATRDFARLSHFEKFGVPEAFAVDLDAVETAFLKLSRRFHPDRQAGASPRERVKSVALTAALNEARSVLKDPVARAEYMLACRGGKTSSEDKRTPDGFLIEMLEQRERLEDGSAEAAEGVIADIAPRRDEAMAIIARELGADEGDLDQVRLQLNTLKYYDNLLAESRELIDG